MRPWFLLALTGCWSSAPPKPVPPAPYAVAPRVEEPPEPPIVCPTFVEDDAACATACPRDAPDDWRGCEALVAKLQSSGYVCSTLHPRSCIPAAQLPLPPCPPGGCVAVKGRVVQKRVGKTRIELVLTLGQRQGITTQWKARFASFDRQGNATFVPGGDITLTRVDRDSTVGTTTLANSLIEQTPFVLFEP